MLDVLRVPGARRLFLASCVARLPMGAFGLLLILHTEALTGSYAAGGLAAGGYTLALAATNPVLGRIVDRRGQTLVLRAASTLALLAAVVLAALPPDAPAVAIVAGGIVAGACQPPIGACMRALWPVLLGSNEARNAAYAIEAVVLEVVYICGPVVIVAGVGTWSISAALVVCGVALFLGNQAFAASPVSRAWRGSPAVRGERRGGALRGRGVRLLLAVFTLCGLAIGAVEVAVPALLDGMGRKELVGVLLGLWGIGSMAAGLVVAKAGPGTDPPRRLAVLLVVWGLTHAAVGLATSPTGIGVLLLLAGVAISPTLVCANGMLDHIALPGTLTEAFTWTSTGLAAGIAMGSAVAGVLTEVASPAVALFALGAGGVLAGVLVLATAGAALRSEAPSLVT